MLIDATHPEETRVVVTRGNRVEEFDYESATRKQLRGNIYLAKVARIEPSLQAAFVNYGGNRHGFLAFAEIHPDYYQIPVAVREAILKEEALDRQRGRDHGDNGAEGEAETQVLGDDGARPEASGKEPAGEAPPSSEPPLDETRTTPSQETAGAIPPSIEAGEVTSGEAENEREPVALLAGAEGDEAQERKPRDLIPLEAALPAVIYEEFAVAVARGEEARDEIPLHPDDVDDGAAQEDAQPESGPAGAALELPPAGAELPASDDEQGAWESHHRPRGEGTVTSVPEAPAASPVEVVGSEDAMEELPQRHKRRWRHYKIQEVIKRNQIVLIQVVKEERGTKGAALTTYLSLAGRYTVLMPNTPSGGGISRKITVPADRKRLKEIALELEVPEGMGLIIRTAGASRTKAEIKRDFEYLLRLWENVRDLTLKSTAPCLVYEEGNLIKRSIRDLYNKDIDEILVAGDDAHREAKDFMRMLMPSHAKNVIQYKEPEPLFIKYEVERQLNQMFSPVVTLRSGGYIVLNQTEALVAIDVNSGRATREYSIEDTALKTNMEAAEEVARQVRLRDLAGLIVIDFIDMDERRNNRSVERKLKEALRHDRARIQVGHISHFGLLEMSRQRLRQGVVEVSTMPCPVCQGVGHIRSTESVALMVLRSIEDHLRTQGAADLTASASTEAALYILNHKRAYLRDIELRYGVTIVIQMDENVHGGNFTLTRGASASAPVAVETKAIHMELGQIGSPSEGAGEEEDETATEGEDKRPQRRKRRRRRGRGDQPAGFAFQNGGASPAESGESDDDEDDGEPAQPGIEADASPQPAISGELSARNGAEGEQEAQFRRNRRRGRRGGRRHRDDPAAAGGVPGLGEQPILAYDLNFPKNLELGPINREPAAPIHEPSIPADAAVEPDAAAIEQPAAIAGSTPEAVVGPSAVAEVPAALLVEVMDLSETSTAPVVDPAPEPAPIPAPIQETIAIAPPVEEPKPRPVRTGPPRKGWWQRRIG
jgi:ribonuclease E